MDLTLTLTLTLTLALTSAHVVQQPLARAPATVPPQPTALACCHAVACPLWPGADLRDVMA